MNVLLPIFRPYCSILWACLLVACTTSRAPAPDAAPIDAAAPAAAVVGADARSPRFPARPYHVDSLGGRDASRPAAVLVVLHGFGGDGAGVEQYFRLRPLVARHDLIVVRADGTPNPDGLRFWNAGDTCCDLYEQGPDDVAYLDAVLDDVAAHFPVDPKRVYVLGHSNGGFMAYRYACERAGRVAAIVSLAGEASADPGRCKPSEAVSVLQIQGDADEIVPYAGGNFSSPENLANLKARHFPLPAAGIHTGAFLGAHASVAAWAERDGCAKDEASAGPDLDLEATLPGAETTRTGHRACKPGIGAELWTIRGGSHSPRMKEAWGETIYAFVRDHAKP